MEWLLILGFAFFIGIIIYLWFNPETKKKIFSKPKQDKYAPTNYGEHKDILKQEWLKKK